MDETLASGIAPDELRKKLGPLIDSREPDRLSNGTPLKPNSGNTWRAWFSYQVRDCLGNSVRDRRGKPLQKRVSFSLDVPCSGSGAATKNEARKLTATLREAIVHDCRVLSGLSSDGTATVRDYVCGFIDTRERLGRVEASTASGYRRDANRLFKFIGDRRFDSLTHRDVQKCVLSMAEEYSPNSVIHSFAVLRMSFSYAIINGDITSNPCEHVEMPKRRETRKNTLTFAESRSLSALLYSMPQDWFSVAAILTLECGLRPEETFGLRWEDLSATEDEGRISIRRAVKRSGSGAYVGEPKSAAAHRDIPLSSTLHDYLLRWRRRCAELSLRERDTTVRGGSGHVGSLYIVGYPDGRFRNPHSFTERWGKFARKSGIVGTAGETIIPYDMRHTFATLGIACGADVRAVSGLMGHSDPSLTLRVYANADTEAMRTASARIQASIEGRDGDVLALRGGAV